MRREKDEGLTKGQRRNLFCVFIYREQFFVGQEKEIRSQGPARISRKKKHVMEIMKKFACKTHRGPRNRGPHMN